MTGHAPFGLYWSVFIDERTLFIGVTLNASSIRTGRKSGLFQFKPAMRIMAVSAAHHAFKNFVVKGLIELVFHFAVAAQAKLRVACF